MGKYPCGFVAVDVETANPDRSSICSIGVVDFKDGSEWKTLVDPQDWFLTHHVDIHRIDEAAVRGAPTWDHVSDTVRGLLLDRVVVSHTSFDRVALSRASERWQVDLAACTWLDSEAMARGAWPQRTLPGGFKLQNLCEFLSYELVEHHDALADARAAGHVLLRAMAELGIDHERLFGALAVARNQAVSASCRTSASPKREGSLDAPLAGEVVVFAGKLSLGPSVRADLAAAAGCDVAADVSGKTTILVQGRMEDHRKTRSQRRADEVGADVLSEMEFMDLLGLC